MSRPQFYDHYDEGKKGFASHYQQCPQNPFVTHASQQPSQQRQVPSAAALDQRDLEPISMIDEEAFAKKFREIALFADTDDAEEDAALLHATRTLTVLFHMLMLTFPL
jgi:predicted  nucleic acid-binding Zn-ribbon protein